MGGPLDIFKKKTKVAYSKFLERIIKDEKKRNGTLVNEGAMKKVSTTLKNLDKAVKLVEKDPKSTNLGKLRGYAQTAGTDITTYLKGVAGMANPELHSSMKELKNNIDQMDGSAKALGDLAQHAHNPEAAKKILIKQKNLDAAVNMNIKRLADFKSDLQNLLKADEVDTKKIAELAKKLKKIKSDSKKANNEYLAIQADVRDLF
ncbi:Hypothetical protein PBC10988_6030 [Planctomycetales bacterium 10988]|nr:Hypothetical protein PBC10988_6030 [Planctomycetales bacterium 10988]